METKLYKYTREIKLVEPNPSIILARYEDELTRDALNLLKERYSGTPVILDTLDFRTKNGIIQGCNFFYKAALSGIVGELSREDIIPMTQLISELFLSRGKLEDINTTYEDSGFAYYPAKGVNPELWNHVHEQVKAYCPNINIDEPFVVEGLMDVVKDDSYTSGLRIDFNKDELTIVTQVPILHKGDRRFSSKDAGLLKTGFPYELDKEGGREIFTVGNGLRRLYRSGSGGLNTGSDDLLISNDAGQVHFTKNFSGLRLEEMANNESLLQSIRRDALERARQSYETRKKLIETA